MLKNHLKIAWRSLKSSPLFSTINILGLSLGLAATLILLLYVFNERSYDSMYEDKENIYRVLLHTTDEDLETWANVPSALAPALEENIPEVKQTVRILQHDFGGTASIKAGNKAFIEDKLFWADNAILNMFDVKIIKGSGENVLTQPNTVLLSETTAKRYFGSLDVIGKFLTIDNRIEFEVKGIYKDFANNSSMKCNVIVPFMMQSSAKRPTWDNASFETFISLSSPTTNLADFEKKIQDILDTNVKKENQWYYFSLQPLDEIHLYSASYTDSYLSDLSDVNQVRNLTALALLILIIASINYMNLMTARSQKRAVDVGITKTLGASKSNLISRFYVETGLITFIAMLIGFLGAVAALPLFNSFIGRQMETSALFSIEIIALFVLLWLATTLISGSYPALFLSRFSPKEVLKPSRTKNSISGLVRKGLVVVQFTASIILIVGVVVINNQLEHIQNKNLGYNPDNVVAISLAAIPGGDSNEAMVDAFRKLPSVKSLTRAQGYPGMDVSGRSVYKQNSEQSMGIQTNGAEHDIAEVLQLKLLAGKLLPAQKTSADTIVDVLVNKKIVDFLGMTPEEAIGKNVRMYLGGHSYIKGVVEDFNFKSLHQPIGGYVFHNAPREPREFLLVRFKSETLTQSMSTFEDTFKSIAPDAAFDYKFLDKTLENLYRKERQTALVGLLFSVLAIFVACLGLFGLAAFTAEQRKKEISIRKVLGASVSGIVKLLSSDFVKLVIISLVVAFPVAYYLMNDWLQDFSYRISIGWQPFVFTGLISVIIALLTVSFQAIRAAIANPVNSLKTE